MPDIFMLTRRHYRPASLTSIPMGTPLRILATLALLLGLLISRSGTAMAECTHLSPWPSFRDTAVSANRIAVGTVTATPSDIVASDFTLTVDDWLRGTGQTSIRFHDFRSGAPQPVCPADSMLRVNLGDRLAVAYGARLDGWPHRITSVAYVEPSRPNHFLLPRMETLSLAEVRAIAELPPTDETNEAAVGDSSDLMRELGSPVPLLLAAGVAIHVMRRGLGGRRRP